VSVRKGDEAARPAVYFHKLGTPQDADRLIYAIQDQTTRIPQARVTEDGHYLVITQVEGTEKNGVLLMDMRHPAAPAQALLMDWDALTTSSARRASFISIPPRTRRSAA
jgi:prolyl oligopeptidase